MSEIEKHLEKVKFTPAVVGYLVDGNKILLIERIKVSSDLGKGLIAGFGGKVGDQPEFATETPGEGMDRETLEEIKVKVIDKKEMGKVRFIFGEKDPDSKWNQDVTVFLITRWEGDPQKTESAMPYWFNISEIPWDRMWADNKEWLPKVLSGEKVDAVFLFNGDNSIQEQEINVIGK